MLLAMAATAGCGKPNTETHVPKIAATSTPSPAATARPTEPADKAALALPSTTVAAPTPTQDPAPAATSVPTAIPTSTPPPTPMPTATPTATPTAVATPTPRAAAFVGGYCFGGALSEDPLHCWLLEQAQGDGIIDVDAIYRVGQSLHIYLKQEEPLGEDVYRYLLEKAGTREFECLTIPFTRGCALGVFVYREWWPSTLYILPMSQVYEDIRLLPGGADARLLEIGWPSYRQL